MSRLAALALPRSGETLSPTQTRALKTARDFEAQVLKSMLEQAYAGLSGEGPLGAAAPGQDAWRSMLIEEHARSLSARGGLGLAAFVYRDIMKATGGADARP